MSYLIDIQEIINKPASISNEMLKLWAIKAASEKLKACELTLRIVDKEEIQYLNKTYRNQDKPTNVLAFPSVLPEDIKLEYPLLGDVIICIEVLAKEAEEQQKPLVAHWAHIVIHGVLHLLGYDHIEEDDAIIMQALEIKLLASLGFENPYL